ncbi:MAG TPA: hypothetical protein VGG03_01660 [Thermoanaerobaculia bacterium]
MELRRRLGLLLLLLGLLAGVRPSLAAAAPRLLAPRPGTELTAGSFATIEWEGAPPGAEEWEAFLSLDGGRTYPLRITPHLDRSIRRFAFRVPQVLTREARVMLRFGDERRETEVEAPQRFAIALAGSAWSPPPRIALSAGERPRPGDPGVVFWIEGTRDGRGLQEVAMEEEASSMGPAASARPFWLFPSGPLRGRGRSSLAPPSIPAALQSPVPQRMEPGDSRPLPVPRPVRLLTHRFNE